MWRTLATLCFTRQIRSLVHDRHLLCIWRLVWMQTRTGASAVCHSSFFLGQLGLRWAVWCHLRVVEGRGVVELV
jgi:hypothetical protein